MTETSPVATVNTSKPSLDALPEGERDEIHGKQGRSLPGIELRTVDDAGHELPRDGASFGALEVRGPWVASGYYRPDDDGAPEPDPAGWFPTGDVATLDRHGYLRITDRTKDLIKSGGEWISSVALETLAMTHPAIAEAAVIGIPHPRWLERPLLVAVRRAEAEVTADDLRAWLAGRVASWWIPEEVLFVAELPHTATGKLNKLALRQRYARERGEG